MKIDEKIIYILIIIALIVFIICAVWYSKDTSIGLENTIQRLENGNSKLESELTDSRRSIEELERLNNKIRESNKIASDAIRQSIQSVSTIEGIIDAIEFAVYKLENATSQE